MIRGLHPELQMHAMDQRINAYPPPGILFQTKESCPRAVMPLHYHPGSLDYEIVGCPERESNLESCFVSLVYTTWSVHMNMQQASVIQTIRLSTYIRAANLGLGWLSFAMQFQYQFLKVLIFHSLFGPAILDL